jgi:hypothetical protein
MSSTITTSHGHDHQPGEIIWVTLQVPDRRWWVRLWCWAWRKPLPMRTVTKKGLVSSSTTIQL